LLRVAINHMTLANVSYGALLRTASEAGCVGVEVRNDLAGQLFDGQDPVVAGQMATNRRLRILSIAQVNAFNHFSNLVLKDVKSLVAVATACGAEGISLIPSNDGSGLVEAERRANLLHALHEIKPVLEAKDLVGFVEPLGFASASLRSKAELVDAIEELNANGCFKIVHDTFHHHMATINLADNSAGIDHGGDPGTLAKGDFFPEHTGLVHISGVVDNRVAVEDMADEHRELVTASDRLQSIQQLAALAEGGYIGPVSVEAFSPLVHQFVDPVTKITDSFSYIESEINALAA